MIEEKKSILGKIWQEHHCDEGDVLNIASNLSISLLLSKLLLHRINDDNPALFLSPKLKYLLPNPFHLFDMQKAVDRSIFAINNKEKITIFADYDVDGATSSALLKNIFRDLGVEANIYVPDRISEGYGPNITAMKKIKDDGTRLVFTVDCGAVAYEPLKYAKDLSLDVIVLDHHITNELLPDCVAVVNPNRSDEISQYKYLAAVGVCFLFAVALISELKKNQYFKNRKEPELLKYLDLVALGTVCDVMPLIKLNRCFVFQGLKIMMKKQNIGLKYLSNIAKLEDKPNCYHLGFLLGPRINAGGRVGLASLGSELLSTKCHDRAIDIAKQLDIYNEERKNIESIITAEAIKIAETQTEKASLFIVGRGWHPGVIGIVASRLKDKFNKPVSVIALNDNIGKASCRSITGVNFAEKVNLAKNLGIISAGGGHSMAAGFTVKEDKLDELELFFNNSFKIDIEKLPLNHINFFNATLELSNINIDLVNEIMKLEPFGIGNSEPLFKFTNFSIIKTDILASNHIKCLLSSNNSNIANQISAIAFNNIGTDLGKILLSQKYNLSIIGYLKINYWNNKSSIQLHIKDVISTDDI
jgi:single-stranded-DNA-specific exonuclease